MPSHGYIAPHHGCRKDIVYIEYCETKSSSPKKHMTLKRINLEYGVGSCESVIVKSEVQSEVT